jgi:tryptophan halogenase
MNTEIISVLGGGTAGWLTALFCRQVFPNHRVVLIQSKEIGIVGVGEATTPHIVSFLKNLDIDIHDLLIKTNGTIKNGINFENWNGDGKKYFHSFSEKLVDFYIPGVFKTDCNDFHLRNIIKQNLLLSEHVYLAKLAYGNKIDLDNTSWALHFDANLLAQYLEDIGRSRNIEVVENKLIGIKHTEDGRINSLILDHEQEIFTKFVFDCSGFHRLLIGQVYKEKWISYSKHLPMKKGMPFWLDPDKEIPPYTSAIAMKYGWMWKIPLQHRVGSGYIFDSDYINEDQALSEAESFYNQKLTINKVIPFEAGRFENFWVKNCMAVGLSSSFIEPLESTSLWLTVIQLDFFRQFVNEIDVCDEKSLKLFNKVCRNNMDSILNFVYFHYITKRKDSDFWINFSKDYSPPDSFKDILESLKENNLRQVDLLDGKTLTYFPLSSFLQVGYGLEILNQSINTQGYENVIPNPQDYKNIIDNYFRKTLNHKLFLKNLHT